MKTGLDCTLYVDTSSGGDGTSLTLLGNVGDFTQTFDWDVYKFVTREAGYQQGVKTAAQLEWSGKLRHKDPGTDAAYDKVMDMLHSRTGSVIVLAMTGPKATPGSTGYQCLCQVTKGNQDQGPTTGLMDEVVFTPYPPTDGVAATTLRRAVTGTGGTITYTALPA